MMEVVDKVDTMPMYDFSVLRELRKREGHTIGDVSAMSGISVAVISKLERNQSRAELETLFKLGRVFGMSATDLIAIAEAPMAHRQYESVHKSDGFNFRRISYANFTCLLGTASKGAKVSRPEIHHDDYETCWVLEGCVRLRLSNETQDITPGQSLQFDAIQQHTYEALEDSRMIIIQLKKDKRF